MTGFTLQKNFFRNCEKCLSALFHFSEEHFDSGEFSDILSEEKPVFFNEFGMLLKIKYYAYPNGS